MVENYENHTEYGKLATLSPISISGHALYVHPDSGWILEIWESSTKHPDVVFRFSDYAGNSLFNWLLDCAGKLYPFNAYIISKWAVENFDRLV